MKRLNKIIPLAMVGLLASFLFFVSKGEAIEIPETNKFYPELTYPSSPKVPDFETELVGIDEITGQPIPLAVIVVDTDKPEYMARAEQINNAIDLLYSNNTVRLDVVDDDNYIINPNLNAIFIGNYYTNKATDKYLYRSFREFIDAVRPSNSDGYVIHRIDLHDPNSDAATNIISITARTESAIQEAVNHFVNVMLPSSLPTSTSPLTLPQAGQQGNYWGNPGSPGEVITNSHKLEDAAHMANLYWLTGHEVYAQAFKTIMENYGYLAETDPTETGLGGSGGALDFELWQVMMAWWNIQASVMESNFPNFDDDKRLYFDKLLCWAGQQLYNFSFTWEIIEEFVEYNGQPIGNHELAAQNSLLVTGLYFTKGGYYYDEDTASSFYGALTTQYPEYEINGETNDATQWVDNAHTAYRNYIDYYGTHGEALLWGDDDSGHYIWATPKNIRQYSWITHTPNYFSDGTDHYIADLYFTLLPNTYTQTGFGDTEGFKAPDYEQYILRDWAERYQDSKYEWLLNQMIANPWCQWWNPQYGGYWVRPYHVPEYSSKERMILYFGLGPQLPEITNPDTELADWLGVKVVSLGPQMYNFLNTYENNTNLTPSGLPVFWATGWCSPTTGEAHVVDIDKTINKVVFRSTFDVNGQYMLLDGMQRAGHGHFDALAAIEAAQNARQWLADHDWEEQTREWHSALKISKTDEPTNQQDASFRSSTIAELKDTASFNKAGFLDAQLPYYGEFSEWSELPLVSEWYTNYNRSIYWKRDNQNHDGFFFVLDKVEIGENSGGDYEFLLSWNTLGDVPASYTDTVDLSQDGPEHFVIHTKDADYQDPVVCPDPRGNWDNYIYWDGTPRMIRTTFEETLNPGDVVYVPTILYAYSGSTNPTNPYNYQISLPTGFTEDIGIYKITSSGPTYYIGKAPGSEGIDVDNYTVAANMFYVEEEASELKYVALVNGYFIEQEDQTYFDCDSAIPVSVEFDMDDIEGWNGIIEVDETTTVYLYSPENYDVYLDGELNPVATGWDSINHLIDFEVTAGRHTFMFDNGTTPPPQPEISISDVTVTEGAAGSTTTVTFDVDLSFIGASNVSVQYATVDGTAIAGDDYAATSGTLTITSPNTSGTIDVDVYDDDLIEPEEIFSIVLSNPIGGTLSDNEGICTIIDNDTGSPSGENVALGAPYSVNKLPNGEPYSSASGYPDEGGITMTDGADAYDYSASHPGVTSYSWNDNEAWAAWNGNFDFQITIDLGGVIEGVTQVNIGSMCSSGSGIRFPDSFEIQTSENGADYSTATIITNTLGQPDWLPVINVFEGAFSSRPAQYVRVIFHKGGVSSYTFLDEIEVIAEATTPSNQPPTLDPIDPQSVLEGETLTFTLSASDPDLGDVLTFSYEPTIENAQLDANTGEFTFTPDYSQANTYNVTFTVTDLASASASQPATIEVINVNRAPDIDPIDPITVIAGENAVVNASAADPDNDPIVFSIINQPSKVILEDHGNGTATITCQTNNNMAGETFKLILVASDGELEDTEAIIVRVLPRKPTLLPGPEGKNK